MIVSFISWNMDGILVGLILVHCSNLVQHHILIAITQYNPEYVSLNLIS